MPLKQPADYHVGCFKVSLACSPHFVVLEYKMRMQTASETKAFQELL